MKRENVEPATSIGRYCVRQELQGSIIGVWAGRQALPPCVFTGMRYTLLILVLFFNYSWMHACILGVLYIFFTRTCICNVFPEADAVVLNNLFYP